MPSIKAELKRIFIKNIIVIKFKKICKVKKTPKSKGYKKFLSEDEQKYY